jgi:hypothetical protein
VEDVCVTNNDIQNVEMMLGAEIYEVWGEVNTTVNHWGALTKMMSRE